MELHDPYDHGAGPNLLSWQEIEAYGRINGVHIDSNAAHLFRELSKSYIRLWHLKASQDATKSSGAGFKSAGSVEGLKRIFTKRSEKSLNVEK